MNIAVSSTTLLQLRLNTLTAILLDTVDTLNGVLEYADDESRQNAKFQSEAIMEILTMNC